MNVSLIKYTFLAFHIEVRMLSKDQSTPQPAKISIEYIYISLADVGSYCSIKCEAKQTHRDYV